ncbi:cell wall-binding repeat-containing protein [Herbiconiux daphne]|uniref:Cell wall-binding repeat-containing protein n=1 Tax=Herbiconiux daphne TaxID=2970914 RepID=A0ABT2H046_9MICO|nr:cell wall-binding repeat-containing protein [Herbiconiux daphne]MCS5733197.1 cell wall-binding repeat-containing protein [Herbiconiux daphne]
MRVRAVSVLVAVSTVLSALIPGVGAVADPVADPVAGDGSGLSAISVSRIAGVDRFEEAVRIAQATRSRADVVYLATGNDFPDALSAGPAVVREQGVLLLVPSSGLTAAITAELVSLAPKRVVVVGGPASIPDAVLADVRAAASSASVTRISGADRYEVSRRITAAAFPAIGTQAGFVATGSKFPDALSAGPVAAWWYSPLVLVDGAAASADAPTIATLTALRPAWIAVIGGPASVSGGIETSLTAIRPVDRYQGADRYAVSVAVNDLTGADFGTVYFATGANFPDALAGGVLAGSKRNPLYVVPSDCVPNDVLSRLASHGTRNVVLLGGPASLSPAVERLTPC